MCIVLVYNVCVCSVCVWGSGGKAKLVVVWPLAIMYVNMQTRVSMLEIMNLLIVVCLLVNILLFSYMYL